MALDRENNEAHYRLLRREEVARLLGVSPAHVSALRARGLIKGIKLGKSLRFRLEDIERAVAELAR